VETLGYATDVDVDDEAVRRLVLDTIERGAIDGWTVPILAQRLGLPSLPIRQALDELIARGAVLFELGEYRSADVA
jgi:hypothetical protein